MSRPLARSALIIGLGNVGSRVLGLLRELVIAALFGATAPTDAFRVAFRVPLALYDLFIGGMISAALVPVFSGLTGDRALLTRLISALLTLIVLVLLLVVALLLLAAPWLMPLLAAGYPPEVQQLSVDLVRVLMPSLIFMGLSGVLTALLYAQERFQLPAVAIMAYNAGMVVAALLLHQVFGIASLAIGVLAGAAFQVVLQSPGLRGLPLRPSIDFSDPAVRQVFRLYFPVALGLVVSAAGIAIDTNLASRTGAGNLAAMGFATTLVQFPLGLVATGVSAAVLPSLSRSFQAATPGHDAGVIADPAGYRAALGLGLRLVVVTILPAAVGLTLLREGVIRLLFQRGAFDALAAQRTSSAFLAYAPGLPAAAVDQVLVYGFYARKQTLQPVLVGVVAVGVYLAVGLALLQPLGMPGLALANSAQWTVHMLIMALLTYRSLTGLSGIGLWPTIARTVAATAALAGALTVAAALLPSATGSDALTASAVVVALVIIGAAVYLAALALVGREELRLLASAFRRTPPAP